jgi:hypothetical protein
VLATKKDSLPYGKSLQGLLISMKGDTTLGRPTLVGRFEMLDNTYHEVGEAHLSTLNEPQGLKTLIPSPYYIIIIDADTARYSLRFDCPPVITPLTEGIK